jgi:beta-galactosidase
VRCYLNGLAGERAPLTLSAELRDGGRVLSSVREPIGSGGADYHDLVLEGLGEIELWDLQRPKLYQVVVRLAGSGLEDEIPVRIGFREARFTEKGFFLNGQHLKLRGLNRHQTFPYVGGAMPARVQRRDAFILKNDLKCNLVRTSHYPQSPHFLDACDEAGLLVLEEIPGWQHVGDKAWQDVAVRNVGEMIRRDWNHPSIALWGVRINESDDNHDFYTRTNDLAHRLDPSRQTGGIRYKYDSELLEDVFTMNDFGFPLRPPNHPLYLNTEFVGHMFPTKQIDNVERVAEHVLRHARVHNQLASDERYAGGIGWCAFDYATHKGFGSGDRICYHGVSDIFRIPKPAAALYKSQCDPREEIVLEPGFIWSQGDKSGGGGPGLVPVCSNCDHLIVYIGGQIKREVDPDRKDYGNLAHPPFLVDLTDCWAGDWGDLKIEGYLGGKLAITRTFSGKGADVQLFVEPDDAELVGDGSDATRVVLRATDEYGSPRPFSTGAVSLAIEGPGEIVGENPFALTGGVGAVWVKTKEAAGTIRLTARHPYLGVKTVQIQVRPAPPEAV